MRRPNNLKELKEQVKSFVAKGKINKTLRDLEQKFYLNKLRKEKGDDFKESDPYDEDNWGEEDWTN